MEYRLSKEIDFILVLSGSCRTRFSFDFLFSFLIISNIFRAFYFSLSLPRCNLDPGALIRLSSPLPTTESASLLFSRENFSAFVASSTRVELSHRYPDMMPVYYSLFSLEGCFDVWNRVTRYSAKRRMCVHAASLRIVKNKSKFAGSVQSLGTRCSIISQLQLAFSPFAA